jgi:hypothetical protein
VRAQASFHADDARRHLLERRRETQALDLPSEDNLPVDAKSNQVKDLLADVDADNHRQRCL